MLCLRLELQEVKFMIQRLTGIVENSTVGKSIYAAIDIGGITPIYISPDSDNPYDISANITPGEVERAIKSHPDASAIILPSPNYYGICSDIKKISRLAKKQDRKAHV